MIIQVFIFLFQICWRSQLWGACKYGCWIHSVAFSTNLQWRGILWASQRAANQISFEWTLKSWYWISGENNVILLEINDSMRKYELSVWNPICMENFSSFLTSYLICISGFFLSLWILWEWVTAPKNRCTQGITRPLSTYPLLTLRCVFIP